MAESNNGRAVFGWRLAVGLVQGLALYFLYNAYEAKTWPAGDGALFAPLAIVALYIPVLVILGLGTLRRTALIVWSLAAVAVVAGFAYYDIWHGWPTEPVWQTGGTVEAVRILPAFTTFFFAAVFVFITHTLVTAGDNDRRIIAHYRTHFDIAWKYGLQLALAGVFVLIFWLLLWLGAGLFKAIDLDFLEKLIRHRWFSIPVTTLAIATALHITDGRSVLVRGARSLILALFSWLLPLIVVIGAGFLAALVFTGLGPLWKTRMATALLLTAVAALVVLMNAVYQDGEVEHRPVWLLRIASSAGGLLLLPITALAGYALSLRIGQYGWTVERIFVAACVAVAATLALGYAIAALWPKTWLKPLQRWNFWTAVLVLAVIAALFSPIVDPARISVASQVAQLESGKVKPEKFDFYYLHRAGGRFGKAALQRLAKAKNPAIAGPATEALKNQYSYFVGYTPPPPPAPAELAKRIAVHPDGARLPDSFLKQDWPVQGTNPCLTAETNEHRRCDALVQETSSGPEVIVIYSPADAGSDFYHQVSLYRFVGSRWVEFGHLNGPLCGKDAQALLAGRFTQQAPEQQDLVINGRRWRVFPVHEDLPCK